MPRVVGVDPGTISIDACGLDAGELYLDLSIPTADALADPAAFVSLLRGDSPPDLIAGPSGYGLPLVTAASATDEDLRLAFLAPPGEDGGVGGLRRLAQVLARSGLPVVYTPGAIHLDTVPVHRKVNRVDLGTADKVAGAALGIADQAERLGCPPRDTAFILLEVGGAFTAALAVRGGQVVDGLGGSSGPLGWQSAGAWDGEIAYLAGTVTKDLLFKGGARFLAERPGDGPRVALAAFVESAVKAVRVLLVATPAPREILLSGRALEVPGVEDRLRSELAPVAPLRRLQGFARVAKTPAQGSAGGTALDHLVVISPADARRRLGLG